MRKFIVYLTTVAIILSSFTAFADTKSLSQKKKELEQKIEKSEAEFASAKEKKLYYDEQAEELNKNIEDFDTIINSLEADITEQNNKIEEINTRLEVKEESFGQRLRALQHRGPMSYMDVIFGANSFSDFLVRISLVGDIVDHDKNIINEIAALKSEAIAAKEVLETKQSEQEEARSLVVAEKNRLSALANKQQSLMDELKKDTEAYRKEYEKAVADMERETKIAKSQNAFGSGGSYTGSGEFLWPVPAGGYVSCRFGYRTDPFPSNHTGMDIAIGMGHDIVAAESGKVTRVVHSNYGYGKYIIIDHGDGSSTLYAHCSKLYVTVGQKVSRGEVIAAIGSTGLSTGPHLHFEVIINGKKVNPESYLY